MKKGLLLSLAAGSLLLGAAGNVRADAAGVGLYTITNITANDGVHDVQPVVGRDNEVVWQREVTCGADAAPDCVDNYEIFMYSAATGSVRITDNNMDDYYPEVNARGVIVWMADDGHDWEVWRYDPAVGVPEQITDNEVDDKYPQISANGWMVWNTYDGNDWEISYYIPAADDVLPLTSSLLTDNDEDDFLTSGLMFYFNNQFDYSRPYKDNAPRMSADGKIAWMANDGHDWEIRAYDPAAGSLEQITDNEVDDRYPQINEAGTLTWEQFDGNDFAISYLPAGAAAARYISIDEDGANLEDDLHPKLNSQGDVAWMHYDGHDWEIAHYSAALDTSEIITDNEVDEIYHTINDHGDIAWLAWAPGTYGDNPFILYHYDNTIGETAEVTHFMSYFPYPRLNAGNAVTWFWSQWQGYDIAVATPNPVTMRVVPGRLRWRDHRRWLRVALALPPGVDAAGIDTASLRIKRVDGVDLDTPVMVDRVISADLTMDGTTDLMARFPLADIRHALRPGKRQLVVTGRFLDGTPFGATAGLRIDRPRHRRKSRRHHDHPDRKHKRLRLFSFAESH